MKLKTLLAAALALTCAAAQAATLKWGAQNDILTLDPHSQNHATTHGILQHTYEGLVRYTKDFQVAPSLATSWQLISPPQVRFNLRKNVKFHDGTPFTADDVVFSYGRAKSGGSDVKTYVGSIKEIRKVDDLTIDIVTNEPFPILPDVITNWYIMSKKWCEENRAVEPVDKRKGTENTASFKANGTGPYRLRSRDPNIRTTLQRNPGYWDKIDGNVQE